ncbi:MAG: hypothetical protein JST92_07320 [Deltaproteobacteria bacterium]|nr:hypothetical protein [Deltaproteobacteria bacterium]
MTLLLTEIVIPVDEDPFIVFAADRRISREGKRVAERKKVFAIGARKAGIGYYGLAEVERSRRHREAMETWLDEFLARHTTTTSLQGIADSLAKELNRDVPEHTRKVAESGFHLAGFNAEGHPEFWFIRNVDDQKKVIGIYEARKDHPKHNDVPAPGSLYWFRNGDLRAHEAAWQGMDNTFGELAKSPGFSRSLSPKDYARWVAFKLEIVARFYETFSKASSIGRPVDAFVISQNGIKVVAPAPTPNHLRRNRARSGS